MICESPDQHVDHPPGSLREGSCVRCGRTIPERENSPQRDPHAEHDFIATAMQLAQQSGWPVSPRFPFAVAKRLEMGQREYGTQALERDNMPEILEETPDLGSWSVLELQRLTLADAETLGEDRLDLLAIAAHGAAADFHAKRIMDRRRGGD